MRWWRRVMTSALFIANRRALPAEAKSRALRLFKRALSQWDCQCAIPHP
jgi:hypothetical protein